MGFDTHKNLAVAVVAIAPSPATSGTTLGVGAGQGARFPAAPFNATVWPGTQPPDPLNAEVVRVTARTADTLTITRAAEPPSPARAIIAGDLIMAGITAKTLTDIESGLNFPYIVTGGVRATTLFGQPFLTLATETIDAADNAWLTICGGGTAEASRGAFFLVGGNESLLPGQCRFVAGNTPTGRIEFMTGPEAQRGAMHPSGGFSWGGMSDPGVGQLLVGAAPAAYGVTATQFAPGLATISLAGVNGMVMAFKTAQGDAGSITLSGTTAAYNTASDARLKRNRGPLTDHVLRRTRVHQFDWIHDGTPGRGVFAQEAATVAPFAVTVGSDERDAAGRLMNPWRVDYSKYVPDLIVGWQDHDAQVRELTAALAATAAAVTALTEAVAAPRPSLYQRVCTWLSAWWPEAITP